MTCQRAVKLFLSTLSLRRATHLSESPYLDQQFLSTLSLRRATTDMRQRLIEFRISIHALLAESDHIFSDSVIIFLVFLSTLSLRRATYVPVSKLRVTSNFYPRSPCGERPKAQPYNCAGADISIHALLAESDAPPYNLIIQREKFLSTLSLRRAT